jgi:hypothetical protein
MTTTCRYLLIVLYLLVTQASSAATKNGFDLTDSLIPPERIERGGPPRDGIPSIDKPEFISAAAAGFLRTKDRVLGVYRNGFAKAYPIKILNWREIVNDRFGEEGILVSYCPLCNTGMVFAVSHPDVTSTLGTVWPSASIRSCRSPMGPVDVDQDRLPFSAGSPRAAGNRASRPN